MAKLILKALVSGIAAWILLNVLIFFGTGIYTGIVAGDPNAYVSPTLVSILRYISLFLAFGAVALVFLKKEKKRETAEPLSDQLPLKQPSSYQPPSSPSSFSKPFSKPPLSAFPKPPPFVPPKPAAAPTPTQTPAPAPKPAAPTKIPISAPPTPSPKPDLSPVIPKPSEPVKEFAPIRPPEPILTPRPNPPPSSFGSGEPKPFSPEIKEERDIHSAWPRT